MRSHIEDKARTIGVYVHIPFCAGLCPYCDFVSVRSSVIPEKRYVESILRELSTVAAEQSERLSGSVIETIYLGGGTPTLFSPDAIAMIIEGVRERFMGSPAEVTIEANPDTVDIRSLKGYLKAGADRISIGMQSLDDAVLTSLGRRHTASRAVSAFRMARDAGFGNIGVDLMFAAPAQTLRSWEDTLSGAVELKPEHISLYGLTIEEGTPFGRLYGKKTGHAGPSVQALPDEESEVRMYELAVSALAGYGYRHYEISNFALPGRESAHNSRYWKGSDYIGLGAGAHSCTGCGRWGRRWWNVEGVDEYMDLAACGRSTVAGAESLTREEAMIESVMLGLRMIGTGVSGQEFRERFGLYPKDAFSSCAALEDAGFLLRRGQDILLTPKGTLVANEVVKNILA